MSARTPPPRNKPNESSSAEDGDASSPPLQAGELTLLGKVGRAHGLKGAFYVSGREEPIPVSYGEVLIGKTAETARRATITASSRQSQRPILSCSLAQDRNAAESLTGQWIFVECSRLTRARAGGPRRLAWGDLTQALVVDKHGQTIGRIQQIYNAGSSDIVEILGDDGRRLDLPLTPDYVDLEQEVPEGGLAQLRLEVEASLFDEIWQD